MTDATAANRALVERFAALHAAGDTAGIAGLLAPGVVMRSTLAATPAEGAAAVEQLLAAGIGLWAERRETTVSAIADSASGGVESAVEGTTAAGHEARVRAVTALGLEDGRIASLRVYCDTTPFTA